jgi:hypothetical protein
MAWRALRGPRYGPLKKTRRRVRWTVVLLVVIVFVLPFCSQLGEAADEGERSGVFVALNAGASGLGSGDIGTIPADAGIPYAGLFNATASLGIDPRLVAAVAWAESGFDPNAVSGDGAMGIMQVMPGTATELGLADPFDPAQAIPAGARYLIRQHERFGSWELALAAYNAGPEAVVQAGGIPDIAETQAYVPKVMGKWEEYRQRFASDVPGGCPMAPRGGTDPLPEVEDSMNTPATQAMARAVFACFGHPHAVYCHDPRTGNGGLYEHPRGRACDFMATSGSSASGEEQVWGQALAEWVAAHAEQLHVLYVIWYRKYWEPADGVRPWEEWSTYTNCGSCTTPTGAHTNHVHVSIQLMPGDPESARCKPGISCR